MKISIITPCFNEELNIEECIKRVSDLFKEDLKEYDYEHIFTDNSSTDNTFNILKTFAKNNEKIKLIRNSKNIGAFKNIYHALNYTTGDLIVTQLAADLQDRPEVIKELIQTMQQNSSEIVFGVRVNRKENFITKFFRDLFYYLFNKFSELDIPKVTGEFSLITKNVKEIIVNINDSNPFLRGMLSQIGLPTSYVEFDWDKRKFGKSKTNFVQNFDSAVNGILYVSKKPARFFTFLGFLISVGSIFYGIVSLYLILSGNSSAEPGIPTIILLLVFFAGIQFLILGLLIEYIFSIYKSVRPNVSHVVVETINFE